MAVNNPFYIEPAGNMSQGLSGLSDVLKEVGEERRQREEQEAATQAIQGALQSGDLNEIHAVAAQYPQLANMLYKGMGATQNQQKARTLSRVRQLVSAPPEQRTQVLQRLIQEGESQGLPMTESKRELEFLQQSPEEFDDYLKRMYAGVAPEQEFKAWQESTRDLQEEARQKEAGKLEARRDVDSEGAETLSEEEKTQLGFPEGSVVQRKPDGALNIVYEPSSDTDQRDRRIQNLVSQGVPEQKAANIVDGIVDIEIVPQTGMARLTNKIDETVEEIPIGGPETDRAEVPGDQQLFNLVDDATGVRSGFQSFTARIPGTEVTEEEEQVLNARNQFNTFKNEVARGLVHNSRFPVKEREAVLEAIDISPALFDTPSALRVRLNSTKNFLQTKYDQAIRDANNPRLPQEVRADQGANAAAIKNAIDRIGDPKVNLNEDLGNMTRPEIRNMINDMSDEELDALPSEIRERMAKALQ